METEKNTQNALITKLSELVKHFQNESTDANHRYLHHRDRNCVAAQRSDAWSAAMASAADHVEAVLRAETKKSSSETCTESTAPAGGGLPTAPAHNQQQDNFCGLLNEFLPP